MRRVLLGKIGDGFRIRHSLPGYDALTGPLDGAVFDSDHIPMRQHDGGEFLIQPPNQAGSNVRQNPVQISIGHGLSGNYTIHAIAKPTNQNGGNPALQWFTGWSWSDPSNVYVRSQQAFVMSDSWITPFWYDGIFKATGRFIFGGFQISWDGFNITCRNQCGTQLHVKWAALRF